MEEKAKELFEWKEGKLWQTKPADWSRVVQELRKYEAEKKSINVYIPVTKESFDSSVANTVEDGLSKIVESYVKEGYIPASAQIVGKRIEASHCVDDFHFISFPRPYIYIGAILNMDGTFTHPFVYLYFDLNKGFVYIGRKERVLFNRTVTNFDSNMREMYVYLETKLKRLFDKITAKFTLIWKKIFGMKK